MAKIYAGSAGERAFDLKCERERCAKIADKIAQDHSMGDGEIWVAKKIAEAIRKLDQ